MSNKQKEGLIMKMLYIMGPSGSGKTTLSQQLSETYQQILGKDTVTLISLDPANYLSEGKHIEVNDLISIEDVMEEYDIGPNASIMYAMDFILENLEWLCGKISSRIKWAEQKNSGQIHYPYHLFIVDLPGQIELYINSDIVKNIVKKLQLRFKSDYTFQPCIIELFDCLYMHDLNQFLSLCMMSLATMINFQMPHINVLNKIDMLKNSQVKPNRGLLNELFTVQSAAEIVEELKPLDQQGIETNADMIGKVLDAYGQVSFIPCSLLKPQLVINLIHELQKIFGTLEISMHHPFFQQAVKDCDMFAHERALTELENELEEEDNDEMMRLQKDLEKEALQKKGKF